MTPLVLLLLCGGACVAYVLIQTRLPVCLLPSSLPVSTASVLALVISVVSVSVDGRLDSPPPSGELLDGAAALPNLLSPAPFAFAIWALIYAGEIGGTGAALLVKDAPLSLALEVSNDAWLATSIAQALWCAAFRPWALGSLWLAAVLLASSAACLATSQWRAYRSLATHASQTWAAAMIFTPRSLHLGWLTAATLVNGNAYLAASSVTPANALAAVIASLALAALLSLAFLASGLPAASIAVTWALLAVSKGEAVGPTADALGADVTNAIAMSAGLFAAVLTLVSIAQCITRLPGLLQRFNDPAVLTTATTPTPKTVRVGVGVIVQRADGRLLLGERHGSHGSGRFAFPGGHLEVGESWEETARRELEEETGIKAIEPMQHVATTNDYMEHDAKHYVTIFMRVRVDMTTEARNLEPHKCNGWAWVTWAEVSQVHESRLFMPVVHLLAEGRFDPNA
uniref:Nudix hydrolase domain-containing protein n=1 Tax=Coccolithus braarudii TaxID=221442 RepID=A0A7S0L9V6_9EUKA